MASQRRIAAFIISRPAVGPVNVGAYFVMIRLIASDAGCFCAWVCDCACLGLQCCQCSAQTRGVSQGSHWLNRHGSMLCTAHDILAVHMTVLVNSIQPFAGKQLRSLHVSD